MGVDVGETGRTNVVATGSGGGTVVVDRTVVEGVDRTVVDGAVIGVDGAVTGGVLRVGCAPPCTG
jgi:hypothetical protein